MEKYISGFAIVVYVAYVALSLWFIGAEYREETQALSLAVFVTTPPLMVLLSLTNPKSRNWKSAGSTLMLISIVGIVMILLMIGDII